MLLTHTSNEGDEGHGILLDLCGVLTDNTVSNPRNAYHLHTKNGADMIYTIYTVAICHVDTHKSNCSQIMLSVYLFIHYISISRLWRRRDGGRNM